jgi:pimeloyl-ACP methyl ester carboxylesterase
VNQTVVVEKARHGPQPDRTGFRPRAGGRAAHGRAPVHLQMQDAWLAFARSRDPSHPGVGEWPPDESTRWRMKILVQPCEVVGAPQDSERRAWDHITPRATDRHAMMKTRDAASTPKEEVSMTRRLKRALPIAIALAFLAALVPSPASSSPASGLNVIWMPGYAAPGTPAQYDKVGVIKIGPSSAKNVLVLEPGTSAGGSYFVPLAKWIVSKESGWQVWSVERRENLLEDQSELNLFKEGKTTSTQLYNYYLGYLKNPSVSPHFQIIPNSTVAFAKQWGMNVAVEDLHNVIAAAKKLGGKVVLGGHSLGGSVVTAYATWDFNGRAGADDLAGLVYIDGGSTPTPMSAEQATSELQALGAPSASPWLAFGGITAPYAGVFNGTGSAGALLDPNVPSLGQTSGLLPAALVPPVPVSNVGQYGYALNVATSPPTLLAAQAHLGTGLTTSGALRGWNGAGALTPITRYEAMFSGVGVNNSDGTEWYFPQRLTDDTGAVANGNANPAQSVLDINATMGSDLPKSLLIYAFGARLGGAGVPQDARILAQQSQIPLSNLTLANYQSTYAHNDPAGAYPHNAFFDRLLPFLQKVNSHP